MPCNAAVTITKAAISADHLRSLLTEEIVIQVIQAYLLSAGYQHVPGSWNWDETRVSEKVFCLVPAGVYKKLAAIDFRIRGDWGIGLYYDVPSGVVGSTTTYRKQRKEAERLVAGGTEALAAAADQLFATQVQQALRSLGRAMTTETLTVDNDGQQQTATLFTLHV